MKAIVVHEYGSPDVLVSVRAAGVGPWDALVRTGTGGLAQSLPVTPGSDICGSIHARSTRSRA
jgi:NADPH:quinone reductase-like Zn-dependent oxidoreductase